MEIYITIIIVSILLLFFLIAGISNKSQSTYETPWRRAGRIGEEEVTQIIRMAMRDDDRLFTNVEIFSSLINIYPLLILLYHFITSRSVSIV